MQTKTDHEMPDTLVIKTRILTIFVNYVHSEIVETYVHRLSPSLTFYISSGAGNAGECLSKVRAQRGVRHMLRKLAIGAAVVSGLVMVSVTSATAYTIQRACPAHSIGVVTGAIAGACDLGTVNNDNPLPGQVNTDNMFGTNTWSFLGKVEGLATGADGDLSIVGDGQSGSWSISLANFWATHQQAMLVLKGGNGQGIEPQVYVGYLLQLGTLAGTYTTPFEKNNPTNISHATLYAVTGTGPPGGPSPVPIPAIFPIFAAVMGLFGFVGWRRRRAAATA